MAHFRRDRLQKMRSEWRLLAGMVAYVAIAATLVVVTHGALRTVFAVLLGSALTLLLFFWAIGDVHSLVWAWGGVGEQQTAALLAELPPEWMCEHDIPNGEWSNWDHILVGPAGVFAIDSKNVSRRTVATGDALRSGRLVLPGRAFRGSAKGLYRLLEAEDLRPPFLQAVVVIWGDFPQRSHEEELVVYVHASELLEWLGRQQRARLSPAHAATIADAVRRLRGRRAAALAPSPV